MKKIFKHEFEDCGKDGCLSFDVSDYGPEIRIKMDVQPDGDFTLVANKAGWLHLAKMCAELGLGEYQNGYHFHRDGSFKWSDGAPEFTFCIDNNK